MISEIKLEGMHFHAPHGFYDWERKQNNYFTIDLLVRTPCLLDPEDDLLEGTFNYETAYLLVSKIMKEPVQLLETICKKIIIEVLGSTNVKILSIEVKVSKLQPPLPGRVKSSSVKMIWESKGKNPSSEKS